MLGRFPKGREPRAAFVVLGDPLLGESAVLDLFQDLAHIFANVLVDDPWAAGQVAVLSGVADRIAHVVEPALVHQVDDHLQFVQALEKCDLLGITALYQCVEGCLDQCSHATTEDGLLAEKVALSLIFDGGHEHAGAGAADTLGVGQADVFGVSGGVLMHRQKAGHPNSLGE